MNYTEMLFNRDERLIRMLNDADNKNLELIVEINKKEEELERYKNIIDELEKFINNQNYWFCELGKDLTPFIQVKLIQDKLKELKGSDE